MAQILENVSNILQSKYDKNAKVSSEKSSHHEKRDEFIIDIDVIKNTRKNISKNKEYAGWVLQH